MSCSIWLLTAICLAYGTGDYDKAPWAVPSGPGCGIVQTQNSGPEHPITATAEAAPAAGCPGEEHAGLLARLFSRLRALFSHSSAGGCAACQASRTYACTGCGNGERHGASLRERLASLFHHPSPAAGCCEPAQGMVAKMIPDAAPSYSPYAPYATSTSPYAPAPRSFIQPVSTAAAPAAPRPATEIAKHYLDKVANADDYSWVTGQLFYVHVHADQGLWVVRYASVDKEDRYGGSIVLAPAAPMDGLREGDLVTVRGEILDQGRASRYLGGPLYRATDVGLKDRSKISP